MGGEAGLHSIREAEGREPFKKEAAVKRVKHCRQVNQVNYGEAQSGCNSKISLMNLAKAISVEWQRQKSVWSGFKREGCEKMGNE